MFLDIDMGTTSGEDDHLRKYFNSLRSQMIGETRKSCVEVNEDVTYSPSSPSRPNSQTGVSEDDVAFWYAYDFLLRKKPQKSRIVNLLIVANQRACVELMSLRDAEVRQLRIRHSLEMEVEKKPDLFHKHSQELQETLVKWDDKLRETQVGQRKAFRQLILDHYEAAREESCIGNSI